MMPYHQKVTAEFIRTKVVVTPEGRFRIYTDKRCRNTRRSLQNLYGQKMPQHLKATSELIQTKDAVTPESRFRIYIDT